MWDVQLAKTVLPISWKSSRRKQGCPGSTPTIASEWQQLVCCAGTALMTVTFGVYLGTRPLTVSRHTALGRLTSSGTGWAACCMIMATVAIVTWRLPFRSVVHSQIAPCHRLQGFTSHVLQANVTSSPVASTSDRQFGHETVSPADDDSEILAVSSSSSGGGRPGNMTMVMSSQSEQKMLKSIFAGAVFESGSAPVFNFNVSM